MAITAALCPGGCCDPPRPQPDRFVTGAFAMTNLKVMSADSHMTEPGDLWVQRLDARFRDQAPRVVKNDKGSGPAYLFVGPGIHPMSVAAGFAAGKSGQELRDHMNHGYEAA